MKIVPRYIFFYSVRVHSYIIFIFSTKGYRERVIKQIYGENTPAETHFPKNKKNLRVPEIQDARRYNFLDILYPWYPSLSLSNHVQSDFPIPRLCLKHLPLEYLNIPPLYTSPALTLMPSLVTVECVEALHTSTPSTRVIPPR